MDGNATFKGKFKKTSKIKEKALEAVTDFTDGEFRLKLIKHMKEMESTQKETVELLKAQNALLQAQINALKDEIHQLSEKQVNQAKTIIKYNKENARQLAISERETLEYVMTELKKAIEDNAGGDAVKIVTEEAPILEEVSEGELFEVFDLPADEELIIPDLPDPDEIPDRLDEITDLPEIPEIPDIPEISDIPEIPDELDLSALFEDLAEGAMAEEAVAEPVAEPEPVVEEKQEEPAEDPLAGLGSDPNAIMTPEDIAKLLEAMGQ